MKSQLSQRSPMPSLCQRTSAWDHGKNRCPGPKVRANWSKPFFPSQPDVHRVLEGHMLAVALENHLQSIKAPNFKQKSTRMTNRTPSAGLFRRLLDLSIYYLRCSCPHLSEKCISLHQLRLIHPEGNRSTQAPNGMILRWLHPKGSKLPLSQHLPPWVTGPPNDIARSHQVRR